MTSTAATKANATANNNFASLAVIQEDEALGFAMVENEYVE